MRILGIDPGLQTTGFGVIDADGHALSYVASGTITTTHLAARRPAGAAEGALRRHRRSQVSATSPIARRWRSSSSTCNPQATLLLGQARGACVTALVACQLRVAEYTALQMKQAVAGYGKAAKARCRRWSSGC